MELKRKYSKSGNKSLDQLQKSIERAMEKGMDYEYIMEPFDHKVRKAVRILIAENSCKTYSECAKILGMSLERVRQKLAKTRRIIDWKIDHVEKAEDTREEPMSEYSKEEIDKMVEYIKEGQTKITEFEKNQDVDYDIDTIRQFNWFPNINPVPFLYPLTDNIKITFNNNPKLHDIQEIINRAGRMGYSLRDLFEYMSDDNQTIIKRLFLIDDKNIREYAINHFDRNVPLYERNKKFLEIYKSIHRAIGQELISKFEEKVDINGMIQPREHPLSKPYVFNDTDVANMIYFDWFYTLPREGLMKLRDISESLTN